MAKTSYKQTIKGNKDAAASHKRQAALLAKLIAARKKGLGNLDAQLANARQRNANTRRSTVKDLLGQFESSKEGYDRSTTDAESNVGEVAGSSRLNRAREGTSAMAELSNMQAGETDRIKGMSASIRGLKANLDGGANDYAAAVTNINNSLGDLNTGVTTNINNSLREQNQQDASAFAEHTAGLQQGYADLVDLYGQHGSAWEQAADAQTNKKSVMKSKGTKNVTATQTENWDTTKGSRSAVKHAKSSFDKSAGAANLLADAMGRTFTEEALTIDEMNAQEADPTMRFTAAEMKQNRSNLDELENAGTLRKLAGPEGSKLRKKVVA